MDFEAAHLLVAPGFEDLNLTWIANSHQVQRVTAGRMNKLLTKARLLMSDYLA